MGLFELVLLQDRSHVLNQVDLERLGGPYFSSPHCTSLHWRVNSGIEAIVNKRRISSHIRYSTRRLV